MSDALNDELIASAAAVLNPRKVADRMFGDVGCTLVTAAGHRQFGCVHRHRIGNRLLRRARRGRHHGYGWRVPDRQDRGGVA